MSQGRKIRILCLHGAMLSSALLRLQLARYIPKLEAEHNCTFTFVDAPIPSPPHESIASFYDEPCYRFFHWAPSPVPFRVSQLRDAYDFLYGVIRDRGPFDGVIGFSQGAVMSVALMLHHAATHPDAPPDDLFKFVVLFSCPYLPDLDDDDDSGKPPITWGAIDVPSLHVCGEADDEWFEASKSTFAKNCRPGSATLVVHKGGHLVPTDPPTVNKVIGEIGKLVDRAMEL